MSQVMLILAIGLVAFDFQNLLSWWGGRTITPGAESSDDFTIIVPLFGHPRYFDRRAELLRYQPNVLRGAGGRHDRSWPPSPMSSRAKAGA